MKDIFMQRQKQGSLLKWFAGIAIALTLPDNLTASYIIETFAGNGTAGYLGDAGPAISARLNNPVSVCGDGFGNTFISDAGNQVLRKVTASTGIISTLTNSDAGFTPAGIYTNAAGSLIYIADPDNGKVHQLTIPDGDLSDFAGTGTKGYLGDGGISTVARLDTPTGLFLDPASNLYIADTTTQTVRLVAAGSRLISTIAGTGNSAGYTGDGDAATSATLQAPYSVFVDPLGNAYIADSGNEAIRMVSGITSAVYKPTSDTVSDTNVGDIYTIAGTGGLPSNTDVPARISANGIVIGSSQGICGDGQGNIYFSDITNHVIWKISPPNSTGSRTMTIIAGTSGTAGFSGDNGLATSAELDTPMGIYVDNAGRIYFADSGNHVIRRLTLVPPITAYTSGANENNGQNTIRNDILAIGSQLGSFAGYADPTGQTAGNVTTILNLAFVKSGETPNGPIETPFSTPSFADTLKDIWITGDATNFDILVGGLARNALPTPPDGCTVHFLLSNAPASDPVYWFQSALGSGCRVVVEPGSADPKLGSVLSGLTSTNTLVVGNNLAFPASLSSVPFKIQRHPKIPGSSASTRARITLGANTIFSAPVYGVSLGGAYTTGFAAFSKPASYIIDPQSNLGAITANSSDLSTGTSLTLVALSAPLPTLRTYVNGTGTLGVVTQVNTVTVEPNLPILSPALSSTH